MKPPLTYYGGKQQLSSLINSLIPEHSVYVEPFFGGGAVFFAKPPSKMEVINDINKALINFYRVIKTNYSKLEKEIKSTLHSRDSYRRAMVIYHNSDMFDEVQNAWAVWALANQCYSSILGSSWGYNLKNNTGSVRLNNKRNKFSIELAQRLERVQIECTDGLELITKFDNSNVFFYIDPPYFNSNKGHYRNYSESDFERLLVSLSSIKGKFLLSSYPSALLDKYVKENNWFIKEMDMSLSVVARYNTGKRKREVLVGNYG